jgi:hypothetical protein
VIVDGHHSRLDADFVDYVSDPSHIWKINFGIPHATSHWQVGDSAQQNGHFKMLLSRAKLQLLQFKIKNNLPVALLGSDIVPLVNRAWYKSFGNVVSNKKAITERGWGPLNNKLLLKGTSNKDINLEELPLELNLTDGQSGIVLSTVIQYNLEQVGCERIQANLEY